MLKVLKQSLAELEAQVEFQNPYTGDLQFSRETQALALWAIYERKLYMPDYASFEAYFKEAWRCGIKTAYQLIGMVDDSVGQYGKAAYSSCKLTNWGRILKDNSEGDV